jgi:hypothetical protein
MMRFFLLLPIAIAVATSVAYAQALGPQPPGAHKGTVEQQRACRPDVLRLCRGIQDDDEVTDCLKANVAKLRPACLQVMQSRKGN